MAKRDRLLICTEAAVLAFLLSLTCTGCLATGFRLNSVNLRHLGLICAVTALFCSLCYSWKYSRFLPVLLLAAGVIYLWKTGLFVQSLESVINQLSRVYNAAYGWRILQWSQRTPEMLEQTLPAFLYIFGCGVALVTAWVVARGHTCVVVLVPACLPVMCCFVVTDTAPQLAWLLLFLAVTVLLMLTSTTRQEDVAHGAYLTAILLVPVFAAVTVLFYCIPQTGYNRQPQAQALADRLFRETALQEAWEDVTGQSAVVGSSVDGGRVDLTRVGYRQVSRSEIMRVNSNFSGTVYLRGRALDGYTGTEWYDTEKEPGLYWPEKSELESVGEVVISTRYAHRMMYLPYYVTSIDLDSVTRGVENTKKLAMYSFSCSAVPGKETYTRLYPNGDTPAREENVDYSSICTELPEDTLAWAAPLAEQIAGQYKNPYHKAQAIAAYVRGSAKYDLQTRRMSSNYKDFAQWFLESSDKGYCVHYATAATVLLKAAGIPARYVTGYLATVSEGETTVVLAENAHAWTEYWLPGFGWVMLEATPPAEPEETTEPTPATTPEETPTAPEKQPETTRPAQQNTQTPASPEEPSSESPDRFLPVLLWTGLGLLAVGLVLLQWKLRLLLWQRGLRRDDPNRRAGAYWQEAVRLDRHLGRETDKTLYTLAEKARFSQHRLTEEELLQFEMYLEGARQQLRSRNIFRRLYDMLILALY